jgi:chemotaxis protein CheY-P-specific phosphatase CheC
LSFPSLNPKRLTEIIELAAKQSALALEDIINQPVSISFSQVKIIKSPKEVIALEELIDIPGTVVKLTYDGGFSGAAFLIFSKGQDQRLVQSMFEQNSSLVQSIESQEVIYNEIGNVLLNIYVGTIANQVNAHVDYYIPQLFIHRDKKEWAFELLSSHIPPQQLIFLKSSLGIGEMEITAHIIIIMDYSDEVAKKLC